MTVCITDIPTSPPEPTTLAYPTHCCRCGTETPAGENVYVRGGETECWNPCPATTLEDQ